MPFKSEVMGMCKYIDGIAKQVNNGNTLFMLNNVIHCFNTDFYGIYHPLSKCGLVARGYALVLGAGATA